MKQSIRAKRMAKHHKRLSQVPKLNLVSLMDIFTILVFFLLVNSGDVEVLQTEKSIKLPTSFSEKIPENNLVVLLSATDIVVSGQAIGTVADLAASSADRYEPLIKELRYQAQKAGALKADEALAGRSVTIMADQHLSYELLKKVMATCAAADYRDISLAVTKKELPATQVNTGG